MEEEKVSLVDFSNPGFVMAILMAVVSDFGFVFIIGILIPGVGLVIAVGVGILHYFVGALVLGLTFHRLEHFLPKLILGLAVLLPLPLLTIGLLLSIIAQNRLIEFVITQTAIQAVAVATGGAGEVLEEAAVTETVAEAGVGAAEAGGAATRAGEAAEALGTKEGIEKTAEGTGRTKRKTGRTRQLYEAGEEQGEETEEEKSRERAEELEEIYGIEEPTEKMEELFEPEYNIQNQGVGEAENELEARLRFEAKKEEEVKERRSTEKTGDFNGQPLAPVINMPGTSGDEVELSDNENEINLKEAA